MLYPSTILEEDSQHATRIKYLLMEMKSYNKLLQQIQKPKKLSGEQVPILPFRKKRKAGSVEYLACFF